MCPASITCSREKQITSIHLYWEGTRGTGKKGEKPRDDDECVRSVMVTVGLIQTTSACVIPVFFSSDFLFVIIFTALNVGYLSCFFVSHLICSLSCSGVPSPLSARPVWRRCGKSSWPPTAPLLASSRQRPAPLAPSPVCWSSLPVGLASGAPAPSSDPLSVTSDRPSASIHPSIHPQSMQHAWTGGQ